LFLVALALGPLRKITKPGFVKQISNSIAHGLATNFSRFCVSHL
jgi:hypothetical protein